MTLGLTKSNDIIVDSDNNILNFRGEIASVIHQYDRNSDLTIKVITKYSPELLIFNEIKNKFNIFQFRQILQCFVIIVLLKLIIKKIQNDKLKSPDCN